MLWIMGRFYFIFFKSGACICLSLIGYPAEIYFHGAQWVVTLLGQVLAVLGARYIFVPVLYPLGLRSSFHVSKKRGRSR